MKLLSLTARGPAGLTPSPGRLPAGSGRPPCSPGFEARGSVLSAFSLISFVSRGHALPALPLCLHPSPKPPLDFQSLPLPAFGRRTSSGSLASFSAGSVSGAATRGRYCASTAQCVPIGWTGKVCPSGSVQPRRARSPSPTGNPELSEPVPLGGAAKPPSCAERPRDSFLRPAVRGPRHGPGLQNGAERSLQSTHPPGLPPPPQSRGAGRPLSLSERPRPLDTPGGLPDAPAALPPGPPTSSGLPPPIGGFPSLPDLWGPCRGAGHLSDAAGACWGGGAVREEGPPPAPSAKLRGWVPGLHGMCWLPGRGSELQEGEPPGARPGSPAPLESGCPPSTDPSLGREAGTRGGRNSSLKRRASFPS